MKALVFSLACLAGSAWAQTTVSEEAICRAVEGHVRAALQGKADLQERYEVRARWKGEVALAESGPVEIAVKPLSSRPFRGAELVRVELRANGRTCRTLTVTADTRFYRQVLVASRAIRRGEVFAPEMVGREERDITLEKDGFFTDAAQLQGARARRPAAAGEIITRRHSEAVPVVRQGEPVLLVVDSGNMQLSAQGVALQDGGVGARIRVRNPDSGKVLQGEVVDARTVRMAVRDE